MATDLQLSTTTVNAMVDAATALLNGGYLRIYSGAKPANANTPVTDQTLLAELRFGNPAFGAAEDGVATAEAITGDAAANADGTASWFRALKSDGTTAVYDGTVAASGADLNLVPVTIVTDVKVDVTGMTFTLPAGA